MTESLFKALRVNIFFTGLSRFVGVFRQMIISSQLGLSIWADAFQVGFRLANFFRMLLGEGSIGAAFIPVYTRLVAEGESAEAKKCFSVTFNYLAVALLLLVGWGMLCPEFFVDLTAVGLVGEARERAVLLTRLMFPYLFFIGLAGLLMAVLNAHKHFSISAAHPIIWNLAIILAPFAPVDLPVGVKLGWGVLLGGLLQFLVQVPFLKRFGVGFSFSFDYRLPAFQKILTLLGPVILTAIVARINSIIDQRFASQLQVGSIAALGYAFLLMQTPLGVFGVSVSTAYFPNMAELAMKEDRGPFFEGLRTAILVLAWLAIPATFFLITIGRDLIGFLFQHGQFGASDTLVTYGVFAAYLLGLLPLSLIFIVNRSFYALEDTLTTFYVGLLVVFINYGLDFVFMSWWKLDGLALASSTVAWLQLALLWWFLARLCGRPVFDFDLLAEMTRIAFVSAAMVLVMAYGRIPLLQHLPVERLENLGLLSAEKIDALLQLVIATLLAAPFYLLASHFFRFRGYQALVQKKY